MTAVDCAARCIVGVVVWERTAEGVQALLDGSVWVRQYFSNAFHLYLLGVYAGTHRAMADKSQTDLVEGSSAALRHDLARLARALQCFSRSIDALRAAMRLFVYAWNWRQLHKRAYPRYSAHVRDFVSV